MIKRRCLKGRFVAPWKASSLCSSPKSSLNQRFPALTSVSSCSSNFTTRLLAIADRGSIILWGLARRFLEALILLFELNSLLCAQESRLLFPDSSRNLSTPSNGLSSWKEQNNPSSSTDSGFTVLGRWAWGPCKAVAVKGNTVFIGNGFTFDALDIGNPSCPKIVGEYLTEGVVADIQLRDNLAFVAGGKGLLILDISDSMNPRKIGMIPIGLGPLRVALVDSFAYVSVSAGYVYVVDIADSAHPKLRGVVSAGGQLPTCLAAKGRSVYVGNPEWPDLELVDATKPDSLRSSFVSIGGWGTSAFVKDSFLFVGMRAYDGKRLLKVFNVSTTNLPAELGSVQIGDTANSVFDVKAVTVSGKYAYVATEDSGIFSIDLSNIKDTRIRGHLTRGQNRSSRGNAIASSDGKILAASFSGIWTVKAEHPDSLQEISYFLTGGNGPISIAIRKQFGYVAVGSAGMAILDVSNPGVPIRVGALELPGTSVDISLDGDFAYVAADSIWVVNIADPFLPKVVSHFSVDGIPIDVVARGGRTYVAVYNSGLLIYDVSNPQNPQRINHLTIPAYRIAVIDSLLFVASGSNGVVILDVAGPQHPVELSRIPLYSAGIAVKGSNVYVATDTGLAIVDVSNLEKPVVLSAIATPGGRIAVDASLFHNILYLSYDRLLFIDVSNPYTPHIRGSYTPIVGQAFDVDDNGVYLCDQPAGLTIFKNNLMYLKDGGRGPITKEYQLFQNYPNPFNPMTTIQFVAPQKGKIELDVFDVLGRKILTLLNSTVGAGSHKIIFNAAGLASGIYFCRLHTEFNDLVKTMMYLK